MKARDAPELMQSRADDLADSRHNMQPIYQPKTARSVTRNARPAKSSELRPQRTKKPKRKRAAKPPAVTGYHFRQHGAGWDLRKDVYVTSHDGVRKRKQPYLSHLSREAFRELKRQHRGAALEKAIAEWIAEHDH